MTTSAKSRPTAKSTVSKQTVKPFEQLPGSGFLISPNDIDVEAQLIIMAGFDDAVDTTGDESQVDMKKFAGVLRDIREHAVADQVGWEQFAKGPGAIPRVLELIGAYVALLGESEASAE